MKKLILFLSLLVALPVMAQTPRVNGVQVVPTTNSGQWYFPNAGNVSFVKTLFLGGGAWDFYGPNSSAVIYGLRTNDVNAYFSIESLRGLSSASNTIFWADVQSDTSGTVALLSRTGGGGQSKWDIIGTPTALQMNMSLNGGSPFFHVDETGLRNLGTNYVAGTAIFDGAVSMRNTIRFGNYADFVPALDSVGDVGALTYSAGFSGYDGGTRTLSLSAALQNLSTTASNNTDKVNVQSGVANLLVTTNGTNLGNWTLNGTNNGGMVVSNNPANSNTVFQLPGASPFVTLDGLNRKVIASAITNEGWLTTGGAFTNNGGIFPLNDNTQFGSSTRKWTVNAGSIILGGGASSITSAGAGTITFLDNSTTERMRLTVTGLGIGTNSPQARLHVVPTPGAAVSHFKVSNTNLTDAFLVDSNGNVGIGTNTPGVALDVWGGIQATQLFSLFNGSASAPLLRATDADSGILFNNGTEFSVSQNGVLTVSDQSTGFNIRNTRQYLYHLGLGGNADVGTARHTVGAIRVSNGSTGYGSLLVGGTNDAVFAILGTDAATTNFVVRTNGNVGIGTNAPVDAMHVHGTFSAGGRNFTVAANGGFVALNDSTISGQLTIGSGQNLLWNTKLKLVSTAVGVLGISDHNEVGSPSIMFGFSGARNGSVQSTNPAIHTVNGTTPAIVFMSANTNRENVGINTNAPKAALHVVGSVIHDTTFTTNFTADNGVISTTNVSYVLVSSDSATATQRTFTLTPGERGQLLRIEWTGTNQGEMVDDAATSPAGGESSALWYDHLHAVRHPEPALQRHGLDTRFV